MMIAARLALLAFAVFGFAGAGAALALARQRRANEACADSAMGGLAVVLGAFGCLCTGAATGWSGILAVGGVAVFTSYVLTARQLGLFSVECGSVERLEEATQPHR